MNAAKSPENLRAQSSTIARLYPNFTKQEQERAEDNLLAYIELVRRIFERVRRENPKALTAALKRARLKRKMRHLRLSRID